MTSTKRILALLVLAAAAATAGRVSAQSGATLASDATAGNAVVGDVATAGDVVTGTLANRSGREMRDVRIAVTRAWLWRDEQNPGPINPGGTYFFTVPGPLAPGASAAFRFELPAVDAPAELGSFQVSAAVTGFTEVESPR